MIIHILKDGTVKNDISGHVVKIEDAEPLYQLIENISKKKHESKKERENERAI